MKFSGDPIVEGLNARLRNSTLFSKQWGLIECS